jgi:hypothetical protein
MAPRRTGRLETGIVDNGTSNILQPTISSLVEFVRETIGHLAYAETRIKHKGRYWCKDENPI